MYINFKNKIIKRFSTLCNIKAQNTTCYTFEDNYLLCIRKEDYRSPITLHLIILMDYLFLRKAAYVRNCFPWISDFMRHLQQILNCVSHTRRRIRSGDYFWHFKIRFFSQQLYILVQSSTLRETMMLVRLQRVIEMLKMTSHRLVARKRVRKFCVPVQHCVRLQDVGSNFGDELWERETLRIHGDDGRG